MGICQDTGSADYKVLVEPGPSPHVFNSSSERYFPTASTIMAIHTQITRDVLRGTPTLDKTDQTRGVVNVEGDLMLIPGRGELSRWLERAMGTVSASDSIFSMASELPEFGIGQKIGGIEKVYTDCQVAQMTLSAAQTEQITAAIAVIGKDEINYTGNFLTDWAAATTITGAAARAIQFAEGSLVIGTTSYPVNDFEVVINNNLGGEHRMSRTVQCVEREGDREVMLNMNLPKDVITDGLYLRGDDGLSATLRFISSDGGNFQLDFEALKWADQTPEVSGKGRIGYSLQTRALGDISTGSAELIITNTLGGG